MRHEYEAQYKILALYLLLIMNLKFKFLELLVEHIPGAQNAKVNFLEKYASIKTEVQDNSTVVHNLLNSSINLT